MLDQRAFSVIAVALLLSSWTTTRAAGQWPALPAPADAQIAMVAADAVLDGKHSRIQRLTLKGSVDEALSFYRQQFGERRVERKFRGLQLIATRRDASFTTVQLRAVPAGVEATVIDTALDGARNSSRALLDTRSWLPPDTAVLRSMETSDGEQRSLTLAAANRASLQANRDHLLQALQQRGLRMTKEAPGDLKDGRASLALWFEGGGEEATLTLVDAGRYRSVLIQRVKGGTP